MAARASAMLLPAKSLPKGLIFDPTAPWVVRVSRLEVRAAARSTGNTGRRTGDVDYGVAMVGISSAWRNCLRVSAGAVALEREASSRSARTFRSGVAFGVEQRSSELNERW